MNIPMTFVFKDWQDRTGKSIYQTEVGVRLCMTDFHSGTVFHGSLDLDVDGELDLRAALADGHEPVFYAVEACLPPYLPAGRVGREGKGGCE